MQFASAGLGSVSLGSILLDPGASNDEAKSPIVTELEREDIRASVLMGSLSIDDTLGQPVTAHQTLKNRQPEVGQPILMRYFSQVIFAGMVTRVQKKTPDLTTIHYECECLDWSQILLRRKLRRNFTDATLQAVVDSLLDNELIGEGLTMGTIDARSVVPLVDAHDAKMFDVLRTVAGATGQTFYVDFDKSIQMRSTTLPAAPLILNEANTLLDGSSIKTDTETYRNRQTVIVTGTPPDADTEALTMSVRRENASQIIARAAIEGGTGIYEEIEEITHPTSNDGVDITLLAIGYANLRLATSGAPRQTFSCQTQGYGFRAGQIAIVDLPTFGIAGTFIIQRVSIREQDGISLFHTLELTNSSLQQRAYEAWLGIVATGKVTVQIPSATTNNLQTFNTPGADTWTVPAGVTVVELTCLGGSGCGGAGAQMTDYPPGLGGPTIGANGGIGGNSGRAVTVINVLPGQELAIIVGSASVNGANATANYNAGAGNQTVIGTIGTDGTHSSVSHLGSIVCQGNFGAQGGRGKITVPPGTFQSATITHGTNGVGGGGIGDAISVGGGKIGGAKGVGESYVQPSSGVDGLVEVRW